MIKKTITPKDVVNLLNDALESDPYAIQKLIGSRVHCNKDLAAHKTIQVRQTINGRYHGYRVGMLGILNGLFGKDKRGWGCIAAKLDTNKQIVKFQLLRVKK